MDISLQNSFDNLQDFLLNYLLCFLTPNSGEVIHVCKRFTRQQPVVHTLTINTDINNDAMEIESMKRMARVYNVIILDNMWIWELVGIESIQYLSLSGCKGVTNSTVKVLAKIPNLRTITLSGCTDVTDDGIKHLQNLGKLTQLNMSWACGVPLCIC